MQILDQRLQVYPCKTAKSNVSNRMKYDVQTMEYVKFSRSSSRFLLEFDTVASAKLQTKKIIFASLMSRDIGSCYVSLEMWAIQNELK